MTCSASETPGDRPATFARLVIATGNANKVREIASILDGAPVQVVALDTFPPVAEPEEHGATFAENARAKALYYAAATGAVVVAEDSGLEVDALGGAPGVHSARYGGDTARTYEAKFALIYDQMRQRGVSTSSARFVCALAVAAPGKVVFEARGTVEGEIAPSPRGSGGFGYDPIFHYPPMGCTLAEVPAESKSEVSHRGKAFGALRRFIEVHGLPGRTGEDS